jgi:ABC-type sulfate transport system permease component
VSEISLGLWFVGAVLIGLAAFNIRLPLARRREMNYLADNAKRYESWRGGSRTAAGTNQVSSSDVLRDILRGQIYRWLGVGAVGVVLLIGGFFVR